MSFESLLNEIIEGKIVLFLGDEVAVHAGLPSREELAKYLARKFPEAEAEGGDLLEVCRDIIEMPDYELNMLEDEVRSKLLEGIDPGRFHRLLPAFVWRAIFTVTYDDLIEWAYDDAKEQNRQSFQMVSSPKYTGNLDNPEILHFIPLLGYITEKEYEGRIVLSKSDYDRKRETRRRLLRLLSEFARGGSVLYLGFDPRDRILRDLMDLVKENTEGTFPRGYFLGEVQSKRDTARIEQWGLTIVPRSLEEFVEVLADKKDQVFLGVPCTKVGDLTLRLKRKTISIPAAVARQYKDAFEVLSEETIAEDKEEANFEAFLARELPGWHPYREDWDFRRDGYEEFRKKVENALEKADLYLNRIFVIDGAAAVGKSICLRRLVYDIYQQGHPAVFITGESEYFDEKLLDRFCAELNPQQPEMEMKVDGEEGYPLSTPVLIAVDDLDQKFQHIRRVTNYLRSRNKLFVLTGTTPHNALENRLILTDTWGENIKEPFPYILEKLELPDTMLQEEAKRLVEYFQKRELMNLQQAYNISFWIQMITERWDANYFMTFFQFSKPSRKPLLESLEKEYDRLGKFSKHAYDYICAFHQFGLSLKLELLVRTLKSSYEEFISEVQKDDAREVIKWYGEASGIQLLRSRHRFIAQQVVDLRLGGTSETEKLVAEILENIIPNDRYELNLCRTLLVNIAGPNVPNMPYTNEQLLRLFESVDKAEVKDRVILHHYGILLKEEKKYLEAEELLSYALNLPTEWGAGSRYEREQSILTSLGVLYYKMAEEVTKGTFQSKNHSPEQLIDLAIQTFVSARYGEFPNVYAYHAHANLCKRKGDAAVDLEERIDWYTEALQVLSEAEASFPEEQLELIRELQIQLYSRIGNDQELQARIQILVEHHKSARGYVLKARSLLWNAEENPEQRKKMWRFQRQLGESEVLSEEQRIAYQEAEAVIDEGLRYFPNDRFCLSLKAWLHRRLKPKDLKEYYDILRKWASHPEDKDNLQLLFELGVTAFYVDNYKLGKIEFAELEVKSEGHPQRHLGRAVLLDLETQKPRKISARISRVLSQTLGYLWCSPLQTEIYFSPRYQRGHRRFYRDENVTFELWFSYRGLQARNLDKTNA